MKMLHGLRPIEIPFAFAYVATSSSSRNFIIYLSSFSRRRFPAKRLNQLTTSAAFREAIINSTKYSCSNQLINYKKNRFAEDSGGTCG